MPEFDGVQNFPSQRDNLPTLPIAPFGTLRFTSLTPAFAFDELIAPIRERALWLPLDAAVLDPASTREYVIAANWALYCDNYLEGLHVPFVHAGLAEHLDYASYRTQLFRFASIQTAYARGRGDCAFQLPVGPSRRGHAPLQPGTRGSFPTRCSTFTPGASRSTSSCRSAHDRTKVHYRAYVWDASKRDIGAGADLHRIELEDDAIVESVQRGLQSRLYDRGRYSPSREAAVHHFHRLMAEFLV